ncbi:lipoprotein N-acyltransferase Lnb domain-containing protein, partial [Acinetobacter baumannii]
GIQENELPQVKCSEFENWIGQIKPYKATLIYATDFMGNPSSMFGHTLLRLDPKDQQQLNLVSYAVNYAATVAG